MRKYAVSAVLFSFIFLWSTLLGVRASERYYYDDSWHLYTTPPVVLMVDNKKVYTDVPPLIINDRTIVPTRAFFEQLGAKVEWNDVERGVIVSSASNTVKLRIDERQVLVNEKTLEIEEPDPPPKIVTDANNTGRAMLPLRFVSEGLGFDVEWDDSSRTVNVKTQAAEEVLASDAIPVVADVTATAIVTSAPGATTTPESTMRPVVPPEATSAIKGIVSFEEDLAFHVLINAPGVEMPSSFELATPRRLVLDFKDTVLFEEEGTIACDNEFIKSIRYAYFDKSAARVVFDYEDEKCGYKLVENADGFEVVFSAKTVVDQVKDVIGTVPGDLLVMLDPGHGGSDPGAVGTIGGKVVLKESDVNLAVALRVQKILLENEVKVKMTRTTDVFVDLYERCEIANKAGAKLFVSIHNNSFTNPDVQGTLTYYYKSGESSGYGTTSQKAATIIQSEMVKSMGRQDRGLLDGSRLVVIKGSDMPAVLTEGAFLSNPSELTLLMDDNFRQKQAEGIANGILKVLKTMESK